MSTKPIDIRIAEALDARPQLSGRDWLKALSLFGAEHDATLGCLRALVREAWRSEYVFAHPPSRLSPWAVLRPDEGAWSVVSEGRTEALALVAALEAAPKP